jgi:antitoxin HicB
MRHRLYAYPATLREDENGRFVVEFPDIAWAHTDGATVAEALGEAADCLSEALAEYMATREAIPPPSRPRRGQYLVAPEPTIGLKAALYMAMRDADMTVAGLARALEISHKQARRLIDPRHKTKAATLAGALSAVGYDVAMTVYRHDAA